MADPQRFAEALKQNAAAFETHLPELLELGVADAGGHLDPFRNDEFAFLV